jgi:hypothetical protein
MNDSPITNEPKAAAVAMSDELVTASMSINNTLKIQGTRAFFATHYANAQLDVFGIVSLVQYVLKQNDAVFGRGIEHTDLRAVAIASSMFTSDIIAEVGKLFADAGLRYKPQAVKNVLSTYGKPLIVKITLSSDEDRPRPCSKPRAKWYLVTTPENPQ